MVWYSVALLVHILGVLGVFIATGIEQVVLLRLRAARTTQLVREWVRVMDGVDKLFPPSVLLLVLAGLYMTFTVWGWGQAWIDVSLGTLVLIGILGPAVNGSGLKAIGRAVAVLPDGPLSADLSRLIYDPVLNMSTSITAFLTLGIVFLMTLKPGWLGSLGIMAGALVVAVGVAFISPHTGHEPRIGGQAEPMETVREEVGIK
ncbi:MAG TPA: hypothetical protein VF026_04955 [Ktedonobacteraceae bacterium]